MRGKLTLGDPVVVGGVDLPLANAARLLLAVPTIDGGVTFLGTCPTIRFC